LGCVVYHPVGGLEPTRRWRFRPIVKINANID